MKKILLVGRSGCGKTSLTQALQGGAIVYRKTQAIRYCGFLVDTPGEFMENRRFYSALLVSASRVDLIGLVQDATCPHSIFPPKFAAMFRKQVIGIISKTDRQQGDIEHLSRLLQRAGASPIFRTSAVDRSGLADLLAHLS
jgi:ethanolamine utilization protein EutP